MNDSRSGLIYLPPPSQEGTMPLEEAIGAFHDEEVREVLRLERQYRPLYIMPVGKPV